MSLEYHINVTIGTFVTLVIAWKSRRVVISAPPKNTTQIHQIHLRRWGDNHTFPHILGKVHRREEPFHFYLGDTTQTYTR